MLKEFLSKIANAIRNALGTTDTINAQNFPNKIAEVYESGQKSEYDKFWDNYQDYGNRTNYNYAFRNAGWNSETFNPKYDIVCEGEIIQTFYQCGEIGDISSILKRNGVILDFSKAAKLNGVFYGGGVTKLPAIDVSSCIEFISTFGSNSLIEIEGIFGIQENATFNTATFSSNSLQIIGEITGVIGSAISFQYCRHLSKESIKNIINVLSSNTSNLTLTLSKAAVDNSFETSSGARDGSTSEEWTALIATKSNWTISLV